MKQVWFMSFPGSAVVRFHFVVPPIRGWYDEHVQPVVDEILDDIPRELRKHNRETSTWEIPISHWSSVRQMLQENYFEIVEQAMDLKEGWRGTTQQIAGFGLAGGCLLGFLFLANLVIHFLSGGAGSLRLYFFLEICLTSFFAVRFRKYRYLLFLAPMLWLYKPIAPIHLGSWFLWQVINLVSVLVMLASGAYILQQADEERLSDRWWSTL